MSEMPPIAAVVVTYNRLSTLRLTLPRVLAEPEPLVAVAELADSSVNLVVRPWCVKGDYWPLRFDLNRKIKADLEAAGCSIPFPQQDVHLYAAGEGAAQTPGDPDVSRSV